MFSNQKCVNKSIPLSYDEACLDLYSNATKEITLLGHYDECWVCTDEELAVLPPGGNSSILINTKYKIDLTYRYESLLWGLNGECRFEENGTYGLNFSDSRVTSDCYVINAPDQPYLPILGAIIFFLLFGTIWYGIKCLYRCGCTSDMRRQFVQFTELEKDLGAPGTSQTPQIPKQVQYARRRIKSLDVFRGIVIAIMIFVNYGGGQYVFFKHSIWNGLTVADLVFPCFAWIMGFSIVVSLRSHLRANKSKKLLAYKAVRRCLMLIFLGIALNTAGKGWSEWMDGLKAVRMDEWGNEENGPVRNTIDVSSLRLPGVLQRLGVVGLIVTLMEIFLMAPQPILEYGRFNVISDVLEAWIQWIIVIAMAAIHTIITFAWKLPGCPRGYVGPGGYNFYSQYFNCTGGVAGYIDRAVFGEAHIFQHPTCEKMYHTTLPFDPEGLLGTLTTVLTVYLGAQAGRIMLTYNDPKSRMIRFFGWHVITTVLALSISGFDQNNALVPINKNLWSLSFALITASIAFLIQNILYVMVDVKRHWGGRPLFYPGMNPIILYVGHILTKNMFPWAWTPTYSTHRELLFMNVWGTILWIAIAVGLYKKRVFLRL